MAGISSFIPNYSGHRLGAPHEKAASHASLFQMRWGAGRHAAGTASMKVGDQELYNALVRLDRRVAYNPRLLKEAYLKGARLARETIAQEVSAKTTLPVAGAKRRIRIRKARNPRNAFVAMSVAEQASKIHAGRLKLSVGRNGRVRSIPGVSATGAFLMNRKSWRGQKRRVYTRASGELTAIAHDITIADVMRSRGRATARVVIDRSLREMRRRQNNLTRRTLGQTRQGYSYRDRR